jgi:hypothetical protein
MPEATLNESTPPGFFIQGKELKPEDVGSKVTYIPRHRRGNITLQAVEEKNKFAEVEGGTIMSWNERGVMVDYTRNKCRTSFDDLLWG